jgi:hypothetical protein
LHVFIFTKVCSILLGLMLCSLGSVAGATSPTSYDLKLDTNMYQTATLNAKQKPVTYRAYTNLVYVSHPVDVNYEKMNIYVPEAYFKNETINGYTAKTAPIFMPNGVGGYMPGEAGTPSEHGMFGDNQNEPNAILQALEHGYVVAAPAIRGRTLTDTNGKPTPVKLLPASSTIKQQYVTCVTTKTCSLPATQKRLFLTAPAPAVLCPLF